MNRSYKIVAVAALVLSALALAAGVVALLDRPAGTDDLETEVAALQRQLKRTQDDLTNVEADVMDPDVLVY